MGDFDTDAIYNRYAPTIETTPPLRNIRSIKYNGSYWIACGSEVIKSQSVSNTYTQAVNSENTAYFWDMTITGDKCLESFYSQTLYVQPMNYNEALTRDRMLNSRRNVATYTTVKEQELARSRFLFQQLKSRNQVPINTTIYSLHTMAMSADGKTWTLIEDNPFSRASRVTSAYASVSGTRGVANDLAWNGTTWLAIGNGSRHFRNQNGTWTLADPNFSTNCRISTSTDGKTWTRQAGPIYEVVDSNGNGQSMELYGVACSSSVWVVVGVRGRKRVPNPFPLLSHIPYYLYGSIYRSTDGQNWELCETTMTTARSVAYNGTTWLAVGDQIVASTDSITWSNRLLRESVVENSTSALQFNDVAWSGTHWLAVGVYDRNASLSDSGGFIAKSDDGIDWEIQQNTPSFVKCVWDGEKWILGGFMIYAGIDGVNWTKTLSAGSGITAIGADVVLPILGGTLNTVSSLLVGFGQPSSVYRSVTTGWRPQKIINDTANWALAARLQREFYSVIWANSKWFLLGNDNGPINIRNGLAVSTDGLQWTFPSTFTIEFPRGIATDGSLFVAVGNSAKETPILIEPPGGPNWYTTGGKIQTSTDGNTWTTRSCPLTFPYYVARNSSVWVSGGVGGIMYSTNGTTWTQSTVCPLTIVNCVAWNGYIWIAVGSGPSNTIATSVDGIRWFSDPSTLNIFTEGKFVAWNRRTWVAVGIGTNTIATSVDGISWIGRRTSTFTSVGRYVAWDGTKWISSGIGGNNLATSTDGINWTTFSVGLGLVNCFANKSISLPYTGVENQNILSTINQGVSSTTTTTNTVVAEEEAAAELAANQAAAAAAAAAALALRNASKASAASKRTTFLSFKNQVSEQYTPLLDTTYTTLSVSEPYYFSAARTAYEFFDYKTATVQLLYDTIYNDANPQILLDTTLAELTAVLTLANTKVLEFFEAARECYAVLIDAAYDSVYNSSLSAMITAYGHSPLTSFYNTKSVALATKVGNANSVFNTEVTSVNNLPNLATTYSNVIYVNLNETRPSTYLTDNSNPFTYVYTLSRIYPTFVVPYKEKCDEYYEAALDEAEQWDTLAEVEFDDGPLIADFGALYQTYFYTFVGGAFIPNLDKLPTVVKLFQNLYEEYAHPGKYPEELGSLFQTLKTALDTVETTKNNAIAYTRTKIDTTIKNKLDEFKTITKTKFTGSLEIYDHLRLLLSNTYYSTSVYITSTRFAYLIGLASLIYDTLFPFIQAVRLSDIEAELDGAKPNARGWGQPSNGLPPDQIGSQGESGWDKYNETYFSRQKLADHIRLHNVNEFVSVGAYGITFQQLPIRQAVLWKDFLDFTNTVTYTQIIEKITEFNDAIDELTTQSMFLNATVDSIVTADLATIQAQVVPAATAYIDNLVVDVQDRSPSEEDLEDFGSISYLGTTLQQYEDTIVSNFTTLQDLAATNLSGKTNEEIATVVNNAISAKNTLNTTQNSSNYKNFLSLIASYRSSLAASTEFVETVEDNISRWTTMKPIAERNMPYTFSVSSGGGVPFIMGIVPTDEDYWVERQYTTFIREDTLEQVECTFNENTQEIETLPALSSSDFAAYSSSALYTKGDFVSYDSGVYICIRDNTPTSTSDTIVGILPTVAKNWKVRRYPYVETLKGTNVEASPENMVPLVPSDYYPYSDLIAYSKNDYVNFEGSVYRCIANQYTKKDIRGIAPTNTVYWVEQQYPLVVYGDITVEASPTNMAQLNASNFGLYNNSDRVYFAGDVVRYSTLNSFVDERTETEYSSGTYIFYLEDDTQAGTKGVRGEPPITQAIAGNYLTRDRWRLIQYPLVTYEGQLIEATPGAFSQLNPNQYNAYSDAINYSNGTVVSYQNNLYRCAISTQLSKGVPVSNTDVWERVVYPYVRYNDIEVQAIPGRIDPLDPTKYALFASNQTYRLGDIVKYEGALYECIDASPTGIPIINIPPTSTTYWERRRYPMVYVNGVYIEANPAFTQVFKEVNPLAVVKYDANWMYNKGDLTAYNGSVYECINVEPPALEGRTITNIVPTNTSYWAADSQFIQSDFDIGSWIPYKLYSEKNYVSFDGYVYRCETEHISQLGTTPDEIPYYWRRITDFAELGLPDWYSSSEEYSINQMVMYRTPTANLPYDQTHILAKFVCISISATAPALYAFDEVRMRDEEDEDGNIIFLKIEGTWNKRGTRRYGRGDTDPFRLAGYPRDIRRRVAMEIEMPYGRAFQSFQDVSTRIPLSNFGFAFSTNPVKPSNATTIYNSLRARAIAAYNTFEPFSTQTFVRNFLTDAYQHITALLALRAIKIDNLLNGDNTSSVADNIYTLDLDLMAPFLKDLNIDTNTFNSQYAGILASGSVNVIKQRYFSLMEPRILKNPYPFMSPIALAATPPRKLFRDLGVGDISDITYNLDVIKSQKYGEFDRTYYYENQPKIDALLDLAGTLTFESKRLVGYTTLFNMLSFGTTMDGRIHCDSCFVNVPILTELTYLMLSSPTDAAVDGTQQLPGTPMYAMNKLLDVSLKPPEYTLPWSRAAADLDLLTWESSNPFVQGLGQVAKGLVGITVGAFQAWSQNNPIMMAINLVVGIDAIAGMITGNSDSWIQATMATNFVKFQSNTQSILNLRYQALLYKNSVTRNKPASPSLNKTGIAVLLDAFGGLLQGYNELIQETYKYVEEISVVDFSISTQIPSKTVNPANFPTPAKPNAPDLIPMKALDELKRTRQGILESITDLKNQLAALNGEPPSATKLVKPVQEYEIRVRTVAPPPPPSPVLKTNAELGLPFPKETRRIQLEGYLQSNSSSLEAGNWKRELNKLNTEKLAWNETKPPGQSTVHFTEPKSLPTITEKVPINQAKYEKDLAKYFEDIVMQQNAKAEYQKILTKRRLLQERILSNTTQKVKIDKALAELEDFNRLAALQNDALTVQYANDVAAWQDTVRQQKVNYHREVAKQRRLTNQIRKTTDQVQLRALAAEQLGQEATVLSTKTTYLNGVQTLQAKLEIYNERIVTSTVFRDFILDTFPINPTRYDAIVSKVTNLTEPFEIRMRSIINRISPVPALKVQITLFLSTRPRMAANIAKILNVAEALAGGSMAGFLGRSLEVGGVIMSAWAGGAFTDSPRLDAPLGSLEEDYAVEEDTLADLS